MPRPPRMVFTLSSVEPMLAKKSRKGPLERCHFCLWHHGKPWLSSEVLSIQRCPKQPEAFVGIAEECWRIQIPANVRLRNLPALLLCLAPQICRKLCKIFQETAFPGLERLANLMTNDSSTIVIVSWARKEEIERRVSRETYSIFPPSQFKAFFCTGPACS